MSRSDLFGDRAASYARVRPTYPEALFDHLERLAPSTRTAWDCGTGSGQSAASLGRRFARVIATDASLRQLAHAVRGERVHYVAAAAEGAPLRSASVDLVTVSAAIHWFDRPRFYDEARRVARPEGVVAVWSYFRGAIAPDIDAIVDRYADEIVGPSWPTSFRENRELYRGLDFPFERLPWPELEARARFDLEGLLAFLGTWSASVAWSRERGADPVDLVRADLTRAWGDASVVREARWSLHGLIGRVRP